MPNDIKMDKTPKGTPSTPEIHQPRGGKDRYYIGIDPGTKGAAVLINRNGYVDHVDFEDGFAAAARWFITTAALYSPALTVLESVHAMPRQGVSSTFKFGRAAGWAQGILDGLCLPYLMVRPQEWQKGLIPRKTGAKDKPSLEVARRLFPTAPLNRKKDHDRADAILLARYASLHNG